MSAANIYYVYEYLREDLTPYYVGKGKNGRWRQEHSVAVPPKERVRFVATDLTEAQAFALEEELIEKYGRKDLGTGVLRNVTSGGEGATPGPEVRAKLSAAKKGKRPNNYGKSYSLKGPRKWNRQGEKHPLYGKTHTEDARKKISEASKKMHQNKPIVECPHCGKQGKQGMAMTRWHFNNCRQAYFS